MFASPAVLPASAASSLNAACTASCSTFAGARSRPTRSVQARRFDLATDSGFRRPASFEGSTHYIASSGAQLKRAARRSLGCGAPACPPAVSPVLASATAAKEEEILAQLKNIIDPDLRTDIVSAGFVKELKIDEAAGRVTFTLELTTPACPIKDLFKADAEKFVKELPWVKECEATLSASSNPAFSTEAKGLKQVANIIAVSSCKGGVGKSTVAVNLAYTLAKMGARVGIMDADIYGPSLPVMVSPASTVVSYSPENLIVPLEYEGVKLMSFGFVQKGGQAAVMRGPIVSNVLNQLLTTTDWGELDYLVVDMPPGTGDIQLTLCQLVNITAAVIVTTPQKLSFVDVVKGIQMFDKVSVPSVAVVENMAYFLCESCSTPHFPFGKGSKEKLVQQFGFENSFDLPIQTSVSDASDKGIPYTIMEGADPATLDAYKSLASAVVQEISKLKFGGDLDRPAVEFDKAANLIELKYPTRGENLGRVRRLNPATVRRKCRCAACVDEFTGAQILQPESVPETIKPVSISPVGNYAVSIAWSDGHPSLFPFRALGTIPEAAPAEAAA
eukprot:tig00000792_g4162.t1